MNKNQEITFMISKFYVCHQRNCNVTKDIIHIDIPGKL